MTQNHGSTTAVNSSDISSEYPFESNYISIFGSKIHYIDEGKGQPIVFLHGNPTSSYLWRNIIPYAVPVGRVIAPDLIGMGKSDKPDIAYRFEDHYKYIAEFLDQLNLTNITLVLHDWGSALGFYYAYNFPEKIKGIAFMEAIYRSGKYSDLPLNFQFLFRMMRTPFLGWFFVSFLNGFVKIIMPRAVKRKLTKTEKEFYSRPYKKLSSRIPVRQWPLEVPLGNRPKDVIEIVDQYHSWLKETEIPKLLFYAQPGGLIQADDAIWISSNFKNTKIIDIGPGIHYIQEDNPHQIGHELANWMTSGLT